MRMHISYRHCDGDRHSNTADAAANIDQSALGGYLRADRDSRHDRTAAHRPQHPTLGGSAEVFLRQLDAVYKARMARGGH
jgi:hypothetical protein